MKRLLGILCGLVALLSAATTHATNHRLPIYIPPPSGLPANQTLNIGTKTFAGYGGCNSSSANGSVPFLNITYTGNFASQLVFQGSVISAGKVSSDSRLKIDSHNCVVPNGTYGGTPTLAVTTATYVITDQNGATGNLNVVAVANRYDVTNIDPGDGSNVDTASCTTTCGSISTQIRTVMEKARASGGPAPGDSIYLRPGAVIDPPVWDRASATTGIVTVGDLRIARASDTAAGGIEDVFLRGNSGGPWTAFTAPAGDWINVTSDVVGGATIRHMQINGTNEVVQGFRFTGLNGQLNYNGTNGFNQGVAVITIGTGATAQSFVQIDNNTFQGTSTVVGQRGQQGIFSVAVGNSGTSGCQSATISFADVTGNGSGAVYHSAIDANGKITQWIRDATGANYDTSGTTATVSSMGCSSTPTATPSLNGLDIITGVNAAGNATTGKNTELYIHDNTFTDMWDGLNLTGNQNTAYTTPTNFWIIGNHFNRPWTASIQLSKAAPVYEDWNDTFNFKYASGNFHNDCEIRLTAGMVNGSTYPYGEKIGNICVRGQGQAGWSDAQGWFDSGPTPDNGITYSGCLAEGNIYVGTFVNGLAFLDCDNTALAAFNTLIQDPVAGVTKPGASGASVIIKYAQSRTFNGTSAYNAVAGSLFVWSGGSPTAKCNVPSLGKGDSANSANAYAAPPADFTTLQTIAQVQAAFQPKASGTLVSANLPALANPVGPCPYNAGTGGYFDYVNRINTAPTP